MRFRLLIIVALLAGAARASNVTNEVTLNSTQPTENNPRSGSLGNALHASLDATENVALDLGFTVTTQDSSPSPIPNESPSAVVTLFSLGLDWEMTDSWTLGVSGQLSPENMTFADTPIAGVGTGHIRSRAAEKAGGLEISYDSAGESNLEWAFSFGTTLTDFAVDQTIPRVTDLAGVLLTAAQVRTAVTAACAKRPTVQNCGKRVLRSLAATPFDLNSLDFSASATAVIFTDTDLTLSADVYHYFEDATQLSYAALIFNGRGGAGVPVAPLQYLIRPEVVHRWGDFSAKLWLQAGKYVTGIGDNTAAAGLKLQYKFTKTFKMWATVLGSRDVDDQGNTTGSGAFSLGAGYRF